MEEKTVSIIVPVYNAEEYLERCVKSLRQQSYDNTEILLVDDGSTDGSAELCDRLSKEDANIRVLHMENAGVSMARNRGLEEARGTYLTFVDADDLIRPHMLKYLVRLLEKTGCDVAGCGFLQFSGEEPAQEEAVPTGKSDAEILGGREFMEKGILAGDTSCCNKLFRADSIGNARFARGLTIGEDMLFLLSLADADMRFCRISYKGYCYRMNEESAMNGGFKESYMDQIICWQEARRRMIQKAPALSMKVTSLLMISVMLVVGKLSMLPAKERKRYEAYCESCRQEIKACLKVRGACRELPAAYRVKVTAYRLIPSAYMLGYRLLKKYMTR